MAIPLVQGHGRREIIAGKYRRFFQNLVRKQVLNGFLRVVSVFQVLLFQGRNLAGEFFFERNRHIAAVDAPRHDFFNVAVVVVVFHPQFGGLFGIAIYVKILAQVAEYQVLIAVAVHVVGHHRVHQPEY